MADDLRIRSFPEIAEARARIVAHPGRCALVPHAHDTVCTSFLLSGLMREVDPFAETDFRTPHVTVMPPGMRHRNIFGPEGGVVLAFDFARDAFTEAFQTPEPVRVVARVEPLRLPDLLRSFVAGAAVSVPDAAFELVALAVGAAHPGRVTVLPAALRQACARIDDDPATARIVDVAREAGLHRAHLVRLFRRHLGLTPTQYRRERMVGRAVTGLRHGRGISAVAAEAGFADGAHLARVLRLRFGASPGALRDLLPA